MSRNLTRFDPIAELSSLQRQVFGDGLLAPLRGARLPAVDVFMSGDDSTLTVEAHLPDFDRSDIGVELDDDFLVIQAERHEKEEAKGKRYLMRETSSSVYRRVALPEHADTERIAADFADGVLTVTVPVKAVPAAKHIDIGTPTAHA